MGRRAIAVYGTLKRGEENYLRFLAGKLPVFSGSVEIPYRMYANEEYPMLVPARIPARIRVEVFEVDDDELRRLDALEAPYGYGREHVFLAALGREVEIYVHADPPPSGFSLVESGDWRA